ncbi:unnamed protein product [Cylicocyclus nassatus]|uniref:Uncharacterized protein n=1 Tax=Cylicocyclus nassatus TaxID=53992 RepID=A0AA36DQY0_CYLNA|nr:unnamed protein product [Cylicocyclus nassatus]
MPSARQNSEEELNGTQVTNRSSKKVVTLKLLQQTEKRDEKKVEEQEKLTKNQAGNSAESGSDDSDTKQPNPFDTDPFLEDGEDGEELPEQADKTEIPQLEDLVKQHHKGSQTAPSKTEQVVVSSKSKNDQTLPAIKTTFKEKEKPSSKQLKVEEAAPKDSSKEEKKPLSKLSKYDKEAIKDLNEVFHRDDSEIITENPKITEFDAELNKYAATFLNLNWQSRGLLLHFCPSYVSYLEEAVRNMTHIKNDHYSTTGALVVVWKVIER